MPMPNFDFSLFLAKRPVLVDNFISEEEKTFGTSSGFLALFTFDIPLKETYKPYVELML